jgi:hypothetical protein
LNIGLGFEWWYKETMFFDFLKGNHFWVSTVTMPGLWGVKGSAHSRGITWELGQDLAACVLYLYGTWPEELVVPGPRTSVGVVHSGCLSV